MSKPPHARRPSIPNPRAFSTWRIAGPLIVIALVLAGCGGGDPAADTTFRIVRPEPTNLDPALALDATSLSYVVEIFGGLLTLTPDFEVVADLAETVPEPELNGDGTTSYRFTIRRDAVFHDGRAVLAEDVAWSLERALDPDTLSLSAPIFLRGIEGAPAFINGESSTLAGVNVLDDHLLEIRTEGFDADFLEKLTFPVAFVVDRAQVESDPTTWAKAPNGTGPFRVEEWTLGEELRLRRNEEYHLESARTASVVFRFGSGNLNQLLADEIDVVTVQADELEAAARDFTLISATSLSWTRIGFNTAVAPFDNPQVRKALALSLDVTEIAAVLGGSADAATGFVSPRMPGYDADFAGIPFDVERARMLLAASGAEPLTMTLAAPGRGVTPEIVPTTIAAMWEQNLGIEVAIEFIDPATFGLALQDGDFEAFIATSTPAFPSIAEVLGEYFQSEAPRNVLGYRNAEVDQLLVTAGMEDDPARRAEAYARAHTLILDDLPAIPLFYPRETVAVSARVEGYRPAGGIVPILRFVSLKD